jgi:hypothetical protein
LIWFLSKKKSNQTEIKKKKNRNRVKPTGFGSVRFFRAKTGSNRFGLVFPVWLGFLDFGSVFFGLTRFFQFGFVFPVWLGFFLVFSVSVQFGFFGFLLIKPNRPVFSKF